MEHYTSNFGLVSNIGLGDLSYQLQQCFCSSTYFEPVWINLPRGYRSGLQLLKSLYSLSVAPCLWYKHLSDALKDEGFKTCVNDPCLLYKDTILVVLYVNDLGIAYLSKTISCLVPWMYAD